jgi:hypothetical protein
VASASRSVPFCELAISWSKHNFLYQQDELWLNLEERAISQLRVHLAKGGIIRRMKQVSRSFFCSRYVVGNLVVLGANPLVVDPHWGVDKE